MLEDPTGLDELRRLGARSVPVLSRGDDYVFAQNIGHVVKFLGLNEATGPVLSPDQLIERLDRFLGAAIRMIPQMPDAKLATEVPNRPRSYRVLGHHIFRIAETFIEVANGAKLEYARLTSTPPDAMQTTADIVAYGADVRQRLAAWWACQARQVGTRDGADLLRPADCCTNTWNAAPGMSASTSGSGSCCSAWPASSRTIRPPRPTSPDCRCPARLWD